MRAAPILAAILLGCATDVQQEARGVPTPGDVSVNVDPVAEVELTTDQQDGRAWRRMDIDQLSRSIERTTGIAWTEIQGGEPVDLFEQLAGSLGKPDYQSSTDEDLTPGLLFQKFLDDAANKTCKLMIDAEVQASQSERRLVVDVDFDAIPSSNAAGIDTNLQSALLSFHGRNLPPGSSEHATWRWLFDTAYGATNDTSRAWRTVCVALLTHPDFYAY